MRASWAGLAVLAGCAPTVRLGRALAPSGYVIPETPTGRNAVVTVDPGYRGSEVGPFDAPVAFSQEGEAFLSPVWLTDRGTIEVRPMVPSTEIAVYVRHVGLVRRDFERVMVRTGSLERRIPEVIRPMPSGPLDGPYTLRIRDLQSPYSDDQLQDGDLLLLEVSAPDQPVERYLFRAFEFGLQTRPGVAVLTRVPLPFVDSQQGVGLSPVLALDLALGWRSRGRSPVASFFGEELALVVSVGIGNTELEQELAAPNLGGTFNSALAGGGIQVFRIASVVALANASAPFRHDQEAGWTLAVGVDAVQLARFLEGIGDRLAKDHPLAEDGGF